MVSVEVPGPPWSRPQVLGNSAMASRNRRIRARKMTGRSRGIWISQKIRRRLAPRIRAASTGSAGREERPASMMMKAKGVQFQISSMMMVKMAKFGFASQVKRISVPARKLMMSLIGPERNRSMSAV